MSANAKVLRAAIIYFEMSLGTAAEAGARLYLQTQVFIADYAHKTRRSK